MRHVLVAREYPPAPGGGIGTYSFEVANALVAAGDTVDVIGSRWPGADCAREELHDGRLVVHRLPIEAPGHFFGTVPHPELSAGDREAFIHDGPAGMFARMASALVEVLVQSEPIDVIEAPEYEAPLAPFQARRALGLGPERKPPCVIHLHSPSELIAAANTGPGLPAIASPLALLERYTIAHADYIRCPSRYLAAQAEAHFDLDQGIVEVIPYPFRPQAALARSQAVWHGGSILFMGRLELRKGILEWLDAAVMLAAGDPSLRFVFVGSDHVDAQLGGTRNIERRIPAAFRSRFDFHDHRDAAGLRELLSAARLVVVPSRWENFPFTCIEAMASGVPVVASPEGGMREMITHGVDGWIAPTGAPEDLASTVREALSAGPFGIADAGRQAAASISAICDPATAAVRQRGLVAIPAARPAGVVSGVIDAETVLSMSWKDESVSGLSRWLDVARMVHRAAARPVVTARRVLRRVNAGRIGQGR